MANVTGTAGSETLDYAQGITDGDDTIRPLDGDDTVYGRGGNDTLIWGGGIDQFDGGDGFDTADFSGAPGPIQIQFLQTNVNVYPRVGGEPEWYGATFLYNVEAIIGTRYNDDLWGNPYGTSHLYGGDGNDYVRTMSSQGALGDTMDGGAGFDFLDYYYAQGAVDINLANNTISGVGAVGDAIANFEHVNGGGYGDDIIGQADGNDLRGQGGDDYLKGVGGDDTLDGGGGADTMEGNAGNDVYTVENPGDVVDEDNFGAGYDTVYAAVSFDSAAGQGRGEIEVIILSGAAIVGGGDTGANTITGTAGNNLLKGYAGNDTLIGAGGADTMQGGAGNDVYVIADATVFIDESQPGSDGIDTVQVGVTYTLPVALGSSGYIENVQLTGAAAINATGNDLANFLVGNTGTNVLTGGIGNDTLTGGGGVDTMRGGAGSDTYWIDGDDIVQETAAELSSVDTIQFAGDFDLANMGSRIQGTIENLTILGTGFFTGKGNDVRNFLTGNTGNNQLDGRAGNDNLNGGAGDDTLLGGDGNDLLDGWLGIDELRGQLGNDTYYIGGATDRIIELAGQGQDTVLTEVDYVLGANADIQIFETKNAAGTSSVDLTGNDVAQKISGNAGNNILRGLGGNDTLVGGGGIDEMHGGKGDDFFYVDANSDRVRENAGEGFDRVLTTGSFTLAAGASIEVLQATPPDGLAALQLRGNAFGQTIVGNNGTTYIDGGGGADTMYGNGGDDTYVVDNAGDVVTEASGGGTDTIQTSITYGIRGGQFVEVLKTTNAAGTGAIDLTGNEYAQIIEGNDGVNVIQSGRGADRVIGHGGADVLNIGAADGAVDTLVWIEPSDSTGPTRDRVIGLNMDQDRLDFSVTPGVVKLANTGTLSSGSFDTDIAKAVEGKFVNGGVIDAVLFDPSLGNLNADGQRYLIIDADNNGLYAPGFDYVVQLQGATGTLSPSDFI